MKYNNNVSKKRGVNDVSLTDNDVRVEGTKTISEVLYVNTVLTSLNLKCEEEWKEKVIHE